MPALQEDHGQQALQQLGYEPSVCLTTKIKTFKINAHFESSKNSHSILTPSMFFQTSQAMSTVPAIKIELPG